MRLITTNRAGITLNIIVTCLMFISLKHYSQNDTLKKEKAKAELLDLYFSAGPSKFPVFSITQKDFKKIVPDSKLMNGDLMEVDNNDYNDFPFYTTSEGGHYESVSAIGLYAAAGVTLKLKSEENKNIDGPWLKLGMNYFSTFTLLNSGVYKTTTKKYDTMYMAGSIPVQRDSVNFRGLAYDYSCKSINFEATLLYKFNDKGIFSVFGGPGAMIGSDFNGLARVTTTQFLSASDYFILSPVDRTYYKSDFKEVKQKEEFKYGPNFSFGLFIVCGIDLRLGNSFAVIKHTHLFAEVKPMFRGNGVRGGGIQQSVLYSGAVGFRYEFQ